MSFSLINIAESAQITINFKRLKNIVLGEKYDLNVVLSKEKLMQELHKRWLKKDRATTILSFPLTPASGEIFLCPNYIKKEAKKYNLNYKLYLKKIYIHGLLHLKGLEHSKKMEQEEDKILKII